MKPLRTLVVGVRGIGRAHAKAIASLPAYELVSICDLNEPLAREVSAELECAFDGDLSKALAKRCPDVVVVATPSASHAQIVFQAVAAGVRGIYCEKPMAVHLGDARRMVDICEREDVALAVNHQRRMLPVFRTMKRLIDEGAIGEVEWIRACCAGDVLSDGTHTVDSLRFLAGSEAEWVNASIYRSRKDPQEPKGMGFDASGGWRFGHPVEDGAHAAIQFANGIRAEMLTGTLFPKNRFYQDFEVFGSKGRLWRKSDGQSPQLQINDGVRGWVEVPLADADHNQKFRLFASTIHEGTSHPLDGREGLKDMELVTAIYESARLRDRVSLPATQERFPLELMIEEGQI
ncbi:MAG TPA: Gfo/Idh/MocA family oxidoreductase [Fimbriimonas sp.]